MDTSSAAAECVTLQAAAGFNIHLFPTGQGNIVGNPIEPVVKLTANPLTVKGMGEHIDCDVSKILSREMNMFISLERIFDTSQSICSPIPFTVKGLAVNFTTGSIGLPTIFPCPVGNKCILNPAAAWSVTHSAAADDVSIKYKPL